MTHRNLTKQLVYASAQSTATLQVKDRAWLSLIPLRVKCLYPLLTQSPAQYPYRKHTSHSLGSKSGALPQEDTVRL